MKQPNFFASGPLDRAADLRRDNAWVAARLSAPNTRIVPIWREKNLLNGDREAPQSVLLSAEHTVWRENRFIETAFLGLLGETAYFAADLSPLEQPHEHPDLQDRGVFVDLRNVGPLLPRDEGAMLAYARGLMWWHWRTKFCGVCGAETRNEEGGHKRKCTSEECGAEHFPRTDPAVIVLVHDGEDRCLLGRSGRFLPGMYSTLAGFLEPGESLEDCVAREIFEEAGVRVSDVQYHSSQPWPFPSSLMLGFYARTEDTELRIDPEELEDARWFERSWLKAVKDSDEFRLPRAVSIARRLVDDWLAAG